MPTLLLNLRRESLLRDWDIHGDSSQRNGSRLLSVSGFTYTGDNLQTSLSTQRHLRVYEEAYGGGVCVNIGGNYASG
jgi:hypothetical protein